MAALAQQESESLSENVRLGIQFRNQQGKVQVNHNRFLGYTKDDDGNLVIDPKEAAVVRRIYAEYLEGASLKQIKQGLERDGILNGAHHAKWYESNLKQILTNEKYIGDALLQKTYTKSILDKKRCKNDGQLPKYYVEGSHDPIIDKEIFLRVQAEVASRANIAGNGKRRTYSSKYALSGIVRCAHCGDVFRRINWNNRGKKSTVWRCVSRVEKGGPDCCARTIRESDLHEAVVTAINDVCLDQASVTRTLMENTRTVIESSADSRILEIDKMLKERQKELVDAGRDEEKTDAIGAEIIRLQEERQNVLSQVAIRKGTQERLEELSEFLRAQTTAITEYSDSLVRRLISRITVYDEKMEVTFKSGLMVEVEM